MAKTGVNFVAPTLLNPPKEYEANVFEQTNRSLRIYFNQLDNAMRNAMATQVPYRTQVAQGAVPGASVVEAYGYNAAMGTTARAVWALGNSAAYVFPSSAVIMAVVSSDAGDTAAPMLIEGLDADYKAISETVLLDATDGTTAVNTTLAYLRVNKVTSVGVPVAGDVTLTNGGVTYAKILVGEGVSYMAQYTVPAGSTLYLDKVTATSHTATGPASYVTYRVQATTSGGSVSLTLPSTFSTGAMVLEYPNAVAYAEKTSVQFQVAANTGTNNVSLAASGLLIAN